MRREYLQSVLDYAERHNLLNTPFQEVISLYEEALRETYEDAIASMVDSSLEQHDITFSEAI